MDICKKLFTVALALVFLSCSGVVFADEVEPSVLNEKITTEYYSDDLNEPLYFDATETVASIGAVLEIPAKSCVLIEVSTGKVLYENESHMKLAPASITKVMALLLTMEAIESGQLTVETKLRASEHACSMGGSQIWLEPGEEMSVDDLLKATVIGSANDATVVLGEAIAGSEESFVAMMNERAAQLGLEDTTFINCTGLDADGHLTSAYDIAIMSKELIKHDLIKNYSTVWMDSLRNGESELVNTNKLVRFYEGCTGLKTGTTSGAGACLTASAERNNMELVAVVMGAANSTDRFNGARKLLDYGFANWSAMGVTADASTLTEIPVKNGVERTVSPVCNETKSVLIEKAKAGELNLITELSPELKAPIQVGQQVGMTRIMLGDEEIGTVPIVAGETVAKKTFLSSFLKVLKSCFSV